MYKLYSMWYQIWTSVWAQRKKSKKQDHFQVKRDEEITIKNSDDKSTFKNIVDRFEKRSDKLYIHEKCKFIVNTNKKGAEAQKVVMFLIYLIPHWDVVLLSKPFLNLFMASGR